MYGMARKNNDLMRQINGSDLQRFENQDDALINKNKNCLDPINVMIDKLK